MVFACCAALLNNTELSMASNVVTFSRLHGTTLEQIAA